MRASSASIFQPSVSRDHSSTRWFFSTTQKIRRTPRRELARLLGRNAHPLLAHDLERELLELSPSGLGIARLGKDARVGREVGVPAGPGEHVRGATVVRRKVSTEHVDQVEVKRASRLVSRGARQQRSSQDLGARLGHDQARVHGGCAVRSVAFAHHREG
jgi:hypothetical protein